MESTKRYTDIGGLGCYMLRVPVILEGQSADIPEPEALHQSSHFRTHRSRHFPTERSCLRRPQTGSWRKRQRRWIAGEGQLWRSTADHPHKDGACSLQRWGGEAYLMARLIVMRVMLLGRDLVTGRFKCLETHGGGTRKSY